MIRKRHPHTSFWRRLPGSAGGIGSPLASSAIGLYLYVVQYTYTHDHWGRPLKTTHSYGNGIQAVLHDNVYDGIGRLMADNRCGALSLPTSYTYNVRSWLTGIQSGVFSEAMSYEAPGTGITSRWGGNISQIVWRSGAETNSRKYAFTYDGYGRLAGAAYSSLRAGDYSTSYAYDANSNLTSITRMAIDGLSGGGAFIPGGIGYILSGNQVALRLQGSSGFNAMAMTANASGADFRQVYYDACGRMVRDDYQGIGKITYNELHLPATIQRVASGSSSVKYGVQYAADGRKLRTGRLDSAVEPTFNGTNDSLEDASEASVELTESIPIINAGIDDGRREREPLVSFITTTDYVGNLVYKDGILEKVLVDGGFITAADMRYHFFVTDHLGNVRVVVNDAGLVEQVNQFYPYGESTDMGQGVWDSIDNPYKWSGKEWDEDQGAYDFGARMYSAADARWTTMDPLSEKYYHISPYAYCAGDPVNLVDPDGRVIAVRRVSDDGTLCEYEWRKENDSWGFYDSDNNAYSGDDSYIQLLTNALNDLMDGASGDDLVKELVDSEERVYVDQSDRFDNSYFPSSNTVCWNPGGSRIGADFVSLGHELAHALDDIKGTYNTNTWISKEQIPGLRKDITYAEVFATHWENKIRQEHGIPLRTAYVMNSSGMFIGPRIIDRRGRSLYFNRAGDTNYKRINIFKSKQRYKY